MTTDGNTAIPVSPTEESMKLADIFRKAADAVVNASTLPETIARLTAQVDDLRSQLEHANMHAQELDQTIHELREQRDEARHDAAEFERNLTESNTTNAKLHSDYAAKVIEYNTVQAERDTARQERDDAQFRVLQLEEEVMRWKTRAEEGRKRISDLQSLFAPDPEPEPAMQSEPEPFGEHGGGLSQPVGPEMPPVIAADPEPEDDRPWWVKEQDHDGLNN